MKDAIVPHQERLTETLEKQRGEKHDMNKEKDIKLPCENEIQSSGDNRRVSFQTENNDSNIDEPQKSFLEKACLSVLKTIKTKKPQHQ